MLSLYFGIVIINIIPRYSCPYYKPFHNWKPVISFNAGPGRETEPSRQNDWIFCIFDPTDVDECMLTGSCTEYELCIDVPGYFYCQPKIGFYVDISTGFTVRKYGKHDAHANVSKKWKPNTPNLNSLPHIYIPSQRHQCHACQRHQFLWESCYTIPREATLPSLNTIWRHQNWG